MHIHTCTCAYTRRTTLTKPFLLSARRAALRKSKSTGNPSSSTHRPMQRARTTRRIAAADGAAMVGQARFPASARGASLQIGNFGPTRSKLRGWFIAPVQSECRAEGQQAHSNERVFASRVIPHMRTHHTTHTHHTRSAKSLGIRIKLFTPPYIRQI